MCIPEVFDFPLCWHQRINFLIVINLHRTVVVCTVVYNIIGVGTLVLGRSKGQEILAKMVMTSVIRPDTLYF